MSAERFPTGPIGLTYRSRLRRKLEELFGIDIRSLVLFRIGLGTMLLADLVKRSRAFREHYTGEGMFPREAAETLEPDSWLFRFYLLSDEPWVQAAGFALGALFAIGVIVGYRTRLCTALSFLNVCSLIRRNPYATHTGDVWLQVLTFWALFLPLGSAGSVDRLRKGAREPPPRQVYSLASACVLLQIAVFYLAAGYLKHQHDLWLRGEALQVFASIVEYTRPFGTTLADYPNVCRFLTYATLVIEGIGPFLLFSPVFTAPLRTALVFVFAAFHVGIQMTVYIGIFEILSIVAVVLFLPGWFWDRLQGWLPFRPGRKDVTRKPREANVVHGRILTWISGTVALLALVVVIASNVNTARAGTIPLPRAVDAYGRQMGLVQNWNIFTNIDQLFFGWFLVLGQTREGRLVDVSTGEEFRGLQPPEHIASFFPNHNARRFWTQAALPPNEWLRGPMLRYLGRRWNASHAEMLFHIALFHVGRVPGQGDSHDRTKRLGVMEFPLPATEESSAIYEGRRAEWRAFLAGMPAIVLRSEPTAVALAERCLEALGGRDAWEATRHLHWRFRGEREHYWDKHTGDVRIQAGDLLLLMNVRTRRGRAFRGNVELQDPLEREELLRKGYAWWVNDSYWLVMPYKMLDPGVVLTKPGETKLADGRAADLLEMTFQGVGLTPQNRYLVSIARDSGLVEEWRYFAKLRDRKPAFVAPWRGWKRFGRILLATERGTGEDWDIWVADELPSSVYTDPAPPDRT